MRHLSGRRFRRLDKESVYVADMGGRADCLCSGCGLCEPCQAGRHLLVEEKRGWWTAAFLGLGVVAVIMLIVVASRTPPVMLDNGISSRIVTDTVPHWQTDYPQPLIADQLIKGTFRFVPSARELFWSPADLCDNVTPNKWTERGHDGWTTMQWCPDVAFALVQWPGWTVWHLGALMSIMGCESSGDPYWNEANWGTWPETRSTVYWLFSHRMKYWADRSTRYLGYAAPYDAHDPRADIRVGVALYMNEGSWHWGGEGGCWGPVRGAVR